MQPGVWGLMSLWHCLRCAKLINLLYSVLAAHSYSFDALKHACQNRQHWESM